MNRILPIGLSVSDNSISSKFNIGIENITIGQSAGLGSTGINNIFLGNRAGLNTTNVTETLLIGMNAGTNILTGIRNIIIGKDTSKITNKLDTISIGYNSIANNSIGIGLDIVSNGNSNISYGFNINSYGINSISYGNYIDIINSLFFIDTLGIDNNTIDNIIVKNISGNTDYDTNSILYKRYDIDNNDKINIIDYNTDIILNFRINTNITFKFSLGFYTDNTDINVFTINNNILYYNNIEYNIREALLYNSDNILRIVNKYNDTSSISIYINSEYDTGFTKNIINKNIINKNINNIRISYDLDDNNIINNYEIINSNITIFDNDIFNNKNTGISFNDFIISINNIDENKYNNIAYGKNISIKGTKNICMGNNLNATGYNSILIGDNISYYDNNKFTKNIQNSIIIGNNNFKNNYNKNSIIIGNDNFNNIIDENDIIKYDKFLKKNPIIISSNVNTVDYVVNIADTILKYDDEITEKQVLLSGLNTYNNKTLPVGIGYSNLDDLNIINNDYKLYVKDGIYTDKIYSETYYGNGENLINISFNGKTTSSLIEGDNLYFTKERVEEILTIYNIGNTQNNNISINDVKNIINSCNYISNNNNIIINSNLNVLGNILLPSGNIGIGTEEPTQKLNILGAIRLNDVILNTNESFLTISENSLPDNKINIGYDKITCNYCIQVIEDSIYKNLILNKLGGFISIGNISASANLHVASGNIYTSNISQRYFNINNAIQTEITPPLRDLIDVCAIFESTIWCKSYVTTSSDIRIKKNIKDIDDEEALNLILAIEPKTYDYIDSVSNTSSNVYGFIAQQIKEVIPKAVVLQQNIIPNIYSVANCEGNNIYLSSNIDLSRIVLISNTTIKLIDESGKEYTDKIIYSSNNHIIVEKEINTSNVFVYGTEVDDFHTIDKSYIYTLNVCATQILSRKIDILQRENEILKQENEIFKNELIQIKTHLGI